MECTTLLRRAGYFFVPLKDDELARHLDASAVEDNKVIEVAELKAIRENILRNRMSTWLQLPEEVFWLDTSIKVFIRVLKNLWNADSDFPNVRARSDWILNQIDVRGWAHRLGGEKGDNLVKFGHAAHILLMLSPPVDTPRVVKDEYWAWVEDRLLKHIEVEYPDLFAWITDWYRREIAEVTEVDLAEGERDGE